MCTHPSPHHPSPPPPLTTTTTKLNSVVQREAAGLGVLPTIMTLLEDDNAAVKVAAANVLSELAGHSAGAKSRLAVGKTTGFSQTPEKV